MWDTYNEDKKPRTDIGTIIKIALFSILGIIIFVIVSNQSVSLLMNVEEFGDIFTKPLYYSTISGLILASIALVRVNVKNRHSLTWYAIQTMINFLKRGDYDSSMSQTLRVGRYSDFKMSPVSFGMWQITKVLIFAPMFANLVFGMATEYMLQGHDVGLGAIGGIFAVPFANIPMNGSFAQENVIPAFPALTLIIPTLLGAIGFRVFVYLGIIGTVSIFSKYAADSVEGKPKFLSYISSAEFIIGGTVFWIGFTMFFYSGIDYNTKYAIGGTLAIGTAFIAYGIFDKIRSRVIIYPAKRQIYIRVLTVLAVVVIVGSIVAVNRGIADAKKIEWIGPYIAQEIAVNRYMAELDQIDVVNYDVKPPAISPSRIQTLVDENREILGNIRLWDKDASAARLKPELGQRNDITIADTDVLRFGNNMYWTSTTAPKIPADVTQENIWFARHILYTHVNKGVLMLEANTGDDVNESQFFPQQRIYYGESGSEGLFKDYWSAYPVGRTESDEVDRFFYNGTGGLDVSPPLSWMFEPNFMLSYPDTAIHVMRYKDIHERMELLYPYFVYDFGYGDSLTASNVDRIDVFTVTDGSKTYWLMPLIMALDTSHVPWSSSPGQPPSFMLKLVGYGLVDSFNGDVQIIITGDDFFSKIFLEQYKDGANVSTNMPEWLKDQIRYPEEMFIWKISKFNKYHVTDPKTFIEATQFYDIPNEASAYYINTKPPGFEELEFVGFQSLELKNSQAKNLVGYMIVQNDLQDLGDMTFYSVPLDSPTKLLGPSAAKEALDKDKDYAQLKTLLKSPRPGENVLYRFGDQEVYFIPVYTSNVGGVVSQLGTIATVGATVTGTYYVGLGDTPVDSFENYLKEVSGLAPTDQVDGNQTNVSKGERITNIEKLFTDAGLTVLKPTSIAAPVEFRELDARYFTESEFNSTETAVKEFIAKFAPEGGRVYEWEKDDRINFGVLTNASGVTENHYISIEVG